jgi:hypothetical protein
MVLIVMHSMLFSQIYKNDTKRSASGAVSPGSGWSISTLRADFVSFTLKFVNPTIKLVKQYNYPGSFWLSFFSALLA